MSEPEHGSGRASQADARPAPISSLRMLEQAASGRPVPPPEPMPLPDQRVRLPMRDGLRLDTNVWLPAAGAGASAGAAARVPAILLRTPYKESVLGFRRLGVLRYVEAGYAVVIQQIRGVGASEGRYTFSAAQERTDGYDTIEWIAAQPWCDGAVGMDGSSYVAITQFAAATARPPHLRCIVPAVPSMDYFNEVPYCGGIYARSHTINWVHLLQIDSLDEQRGGFMGLMPIISQPDVLARMTSRPLIDAADGELSGDFLQHYRDVLAHPTFDDWWRERTLAAADYAAIDVPVLLVNGNFDLSIGALTAWRGLEANAPAGVERSFLIGPWDHGQAYAGGGRRFGPYELGAAADFDLYAARLAFFDRHLRGRGEGPALPGRVTLYVTGANEWRGYDRFPPPGTRPRAYHLGSDGRANTARGDGRLSIEPPRGAQPADLFVDDPTRPQMAPWAAALGADAALDVTELGRDLETLVYATEPLAAPLTLIGQFEACLYVSTDVPDADVVVRAVERLADGGAIVLAFGQLRLRYHQGFDREVFLSPGEIVCARFAFGYVAHRVAAGSRLEVYVAGSNFPLADPNPHVAGPIATAREMVTARQWVHHDQRHPSHVLFPVHED